MQALLHSIRPVDVDGKAIILLCSSPFHRDGIEKPQNRKALLEVLQRHFGDGIEIRTTLEVQSEVNRLEQIMARDLTISRKATISREGLEKKLSELEIEIKRLRELISVHKRHIQVLEMQEAKFGMHAPSHLIIDIADRKSILDEYEKQVSAHKLDASKLIEIYVYELSIRRAKVNIVYNEVEGMIRNNEQEIDLIGTELTGELISQAKNGINILGVMQRLQHTSKGEEEAKILTLLQGIQFTATSLADSRNRLAIQGKLLQSITEEFLFAVDSSNKFISM